MQMWIWRVSYHILVIGHASEIQAHLLLQRHRILWNLNNFSGVCNVYSFRLQPTWSTPAIVGVSEQYSWSLTSYVIGFYCHRYVTVSLVVFRLLLLMYISKHKFPPPCRWYWTNETKSMELVWPPVANFKFLGTRWTGPVVEGWAYRRRHKRKFAPVLN
jgi:hypothetical protein